MDKVDQVCFSSFGKGNVDRVLKYAGNSQILIIIACIAYSLYIMEYGLCLKYYTGQIREVKSVRYIINLLKHLVFLCQSGLRTLLI